MIDNGGYKITGLPKVVAQLVHEPTKTVISVYKPINRFQQWMIKWCFGLKYVRI